MSAFPSRLRSGKDGGNLATELYSDSLFPIALVRIFGLEMGMRRSNARLDHTHGSNRIVQIFQFHECTALPFQQVNRYELGYPLQKAWS